MWNAYLSAARNACIALLAVTLFFNVAQVVRRAAFNASFPWVEELSRVALIWLVCIGAGLLVRSGEHLLLDVFVNRFPAKVGKIVDMTAQALILTFAVIMVVQGMDLVAHAKIELIASGLPLKYVYLAIPVGFTAVAIGALLRIKDILHR